MSFKLAELFVDITGRRGMLDRTLAGVHSGLLGAAGTAGKAGQGIASALLAPLKTIQGQIAGALGVGAIAGGLYSAVSGASNLNETVNKTRQIFGDAADQILDESNRMADSFGAVKQEYIDAATSFGAVFKGVGKGADEAARLGNQLAQLGIDMASFDDKSNATAFGAISAALRGELDPIEQFRVFLSADAVAAEALRMGLAKTKGEMTDAAKKSATLSLILKQTADAQGDAARTSGGFSGQLKFLTGSARNARDELGAALMPIGDALVGGFNGALGALRGLLSGHAAGIAAWAQGVAGMFGRLRETLAGWAAPAIDAVRGILGRAAPAFAALRETGAAAFGAIGSIVQNLGPTVLGVVGGLVSAWSSVETVIAGTTTYLLNKTAELAEAIGEFLGSRAVGSITGGLGGALSWLAGHITSVVGPAFTWLKGMVTGAIDGVIFAFRNWDDITQLVGIKIQERLTNVGELFHWLMNTVKTLLGWLSRNWREALTDTFNAGYAIVKNGLTNIRNLVAATWKYITNPSQGFHFDFTPFSEGFKSTIKELPKIAAPALTSLQGQMDEILDRIGGREAERAKQKVKEALDLGKGEANTPEAGAANTPEAGAAGGAAAKSKEKDKGAVLSLEELGKKIMQGAGAKDVQKQMAETQQKSLEEQQATTAELKKLNNRRNPNVAEWA